MRRSIAILAACALLAPATALAKAPPKGTYECTISGMLFSDVKIKADNRYKRFGKTGKFRAKGTVIREGGIKANKIAFRTGPLKGFKGDWRTVDSGAHEIALKNPEDGFESIYCVKD